MKNKFMSSLLLSCLVLSSPAAFSKDSGENHDKGCKLSGSYGYLYNGNSFDGLPVTFTETGSFTVDKNGVFGGEGTLALYFSNFSGRGPLWLLTHEVQSIPLNTTVVTYDENNPCSGAIDYETTITVSESSNTSLVPVGTVLKNHAPRSNAFTISGQDKNVVDLISTSPFTIASGTAHKQDERFTH